MDLSYTEQIQINKKNKIDGLHPLCKLVVLILYAICTFIIGTFKFTRYEFALGLIGWLVVLLILFAISGEFVKCIKGCKAIMIVFIVIIVAQSLIIPGGEVLFKLGFLTIEQAGVQKAISLGFMVLDVAGIFVWVFQTTDNKEIAQALEDAGVNYKVAYVFVSTLKMIDVLGKNSRTIMNAQKARGVETEGNLIVRAKAFVPSLIPLVLSAVTGAEERVLTLEARGFSVEGKKTRIFKLKKSGFEKQFIVLWVIITIAVLAWRIMTWIL